MTRAPRRAEAEALPEPDRVEGAPHPRETPVLYGHANAEARFLEAFNAGRLHHGWMITGPRGVGKATLAWKIARFLLAAPQDDGGMFAAPAPTSLDIPADHPVLRRTLALSESRLFLLRRGENASGTALSAAIRIEEVRDMIASFHLSSADGGRRVAIIDAADELNTQAANALLKLLEEPPKGVTIILISHQPSRLLSTIRSRCRELRLTGVPAADMAAALAAMKESPDDALALAELSRGSVGEAIRILNLDGLKIYAGLVSLFAALPRIDRGRALTLAEIGAGRGNEPRFDLIVTMLDLFLARLARAGTLGHTPPEAVPGESAVIARLAPDRMTARGWADLAQMLTARARQGRAVNLDPAALLMDMVLRIEETAGLLARR